MSDGIFGLPVVATDRLEASHLYAMSVAVAGPRYETVRTADRYEYEAEVNLRSAWVFWDRPKLFARFAWRAARAAFLAAWHDARGTTETRVVSGGDPRMHAKIVGITS